MTEAPTARACVSGVAWPKDGVFGTTTFTQNNTQLKQVFDGEAALVGFLTLSGQFVYLNKLGGRSREYGSISTMTGP